MLANHLPALAIVSLLYAIAMSSIYAIDSRKIQTERKKSEDELNAERKKEQLALQASVATSKQRSNWFENAVDKNIISAFCLIDSNIWMDENYEPFFIALSNRLSKKKGGKCFIYQPQFDEICNLKDRNRYGSQKSMRARIALSRVEKMQVNNLISVEPMTIQSDPNAYADPLLISLLVKTAKKEPGLRMTLITNDRELRIRTREILRQEQIPEKLLTISSGKKLLEGANAFCIRTGLNIKF